MLFAIILYMFGLSLLALRGAAAVQQGKRRLVLVALASMLVGALALPAICVLSFAG